MFRKSLITTAFSLAAFSSGIQAVQSAEEKEIRADCKVEGEAGGMTGQALEDFVATCTAELMGTTFINVIK